VVFSGEAGLVWVDSSGRSFNRSMDDLADWRGDRGQAGRLPPTGFPRTNKFGTGKL
jgi:topoisomerase-4 subunit A